MLGPRKRKSDGKEQAQDQNLNLPAIEFHGTIPSRLKRHRHCWNKTFERGHRPPEPCLSSLTGRESSLARFNFPPSQPASRPRPPSSIVRLHYDGRHCASFICSFFRLASLRHVTPSDKWCPDTSVCPLSRPPAATATRAALTGGGRQRTHPRLSVYPSSSSISSYRGTVSLSLDISLPSPNFTLFLTICLI
jgi:hypothetical protein